MSLITTWKSAEEIRFSLQDVGMVGIVSCDICANFFDTGGTRGMRYMAGLLEEWGKTVVVQKCILGCCSEEIIRQALRIYRKPLAGCEALVVLSCSAGVQNVMACDPGMKVVGALDTLGTAVITGRRDRHEASSICSFCGQCVLAYTGGICPVDGCPEGRLYGPCEGYDDAGGMCVLDTGRRCVWKEIEARGDAADLRAIERLRRDGNRTELRGPSARTAPPFARKMLGWVAVRLSQVRLGTFFGWIR
ncbi:MAG: methylenetetrahydrofolate reductase C-terminal domain-containing protein [Actinobacteria bacterium]|nr:methylenetetrahydrofolate reductase C-terminal domain-containing protein [Actinomycetota bacterium]